MRKVRRWMALCALIAGLAVYSMGSVAAAAMQAHPAAGPDWSVIAMWAIGLLGVIGGIVLGLFDRRVTRIEERGDTLQRALDREYHTKTDIDRRFDKLDRSVDAFHRRLDRLGVPSVFPSQDERDADH